MVGENEVTGTTEVLVTTLEDISEGETEVLMLDSSREETPLPIEIEELTAESTYELGAEDEEDDDDGYFGQATTRLDPEDLAALVEEDDEEEEDDELDEMEILSNKFYEALEKIHNKGNAEIRLEGVYAFRELIGKRDIIEHLEKNALYDSAPKVRAAAVEIIGKVGDPNSVDILTKAFRDTSDEVKTNALYGLGKTENPQALMTIAIALKDADENIRMGAMEALGLLKAPDGLQFILDGLKDSSLMVKATAVAALGDLGDKENRETVVKIFNNTLEPLVKLAAAYAIVKLGGLKALDIIKESLKEQNILVKVRTCMYLGKLGLKETLPLLEGLSKNTNKIIQQSALKAIQQIQEENKQAEET